MRSTSPGQPFCFTVRSGREYELFTAGTRVMAHADEFEAGEQGEEAAGASAQSAGSQGQLDFEIEFFQEILDRSPRFVDVLRCQGELLTQKGLHERALAVDRRLASLCPDDCIVRYNLACSLALVGDRAAAIRELRRALEQGYDDFEYLWRDADLDSLREEPGYRELLKEYSIPLKPRRRRRVRE